MKESHGKTPDFEEVEQNEHCWHILSEVAVGANSPLKQFVITLVLTNKIKDRVAPLADQPDLKDV